MNQYCAHCHLDTSPGSDHALNPCKEYAPMTDPAEQKAREIVENAKAGESHEVYDCLVTRIAAALREAGGARAELYKAKYLDAVKEINALKADWREMKKALKAECYCTDGGTHPSVCNPCNVIEALNARD